MLHCGGVPRPGLVFPSEAVGMAGLEVDLCRSIAATVFGKEARIEFHPYAVGQDFERLRRGDDAVAFLTGSELSANGLLDAVMPGPAVFHQTNGVMVPADHPAQHLSELAGTMVCAEPGTGPERTLLAYFRSRNATIRYSGWQEEEEMLDAFDVGRCPAVALEMTDLAGRRADAEARGRSVRILPEPLSATPVLAVTGLDDARWAAIIGWSIGTVMQPNGSAEALPVRGAGLGLAPGWQAAARSGGAYDTMVARNLGASSALRLPPALDASWRDGGANCPPGIE